VRAALDEGQYPIGIEITDEQLHSINLERDKFHGEWNQNLSQSNSIVDQIILASLLTLPSSAAVD